MDTHLLSWTSEKLVCKTNSHVKFHFMTQQPFQFQELPITFAASPYCSFTQTSTWLRIRKL